MPVPESDPVTEASEDTRIDTRADSHVETRLLEVEEPDDDGALHDYSADFERSAGAEPGIVVGTTGADA